MKRLAHFYLFHEHHSIEDRCFKINHDIYIYIYIYGISQNTCKHVDKL